MKSAIKIVAFAQGCQTKGILSLIEVAREALDRNGYHLAAAHLDMAFLSVADLAEYPNPADRNNSKELH
jgi:hypothetical protein